MVGMDPVYADLLAPSIQECAALGIFTQQQALEYCGAKVKTGRQMWVKTKRHKVGGLNQCVYRFRDLFHLSWINALGGPQELCVVTTIAGRAFRCVSSV